MRAASFSRKPWAVVLAGGDGTRLRPLVDKLYRDGRPKQFASLVGSRSLLRTTLDRAARLAPVERTIVLTVELHRALASAELDRDGHWILEQPRNRGTAAAILWASMCIERREPGATLVVLPSDHHLVEDDGVADQLLALSALAGSDSNRLFLLAARPTRPDPGYGWIEPGEIIGVAAATPIRTVRRFVEKPARATAESMLRHGWLWSTLIVVGRAATISALGREILPSVHRPLKRAVGRTDQRGAAAALRHAYADMPHADLSRDLLEAVPGRLGVSVLADGNWSDLGTPERVLDVVRASARLPGWAGSVQPESHNVSP